MNPERQLRVCFTKLLPPFCCPVGAKPRYLLGSKRHCGGVPVVVRVSTSCPVTVGHSGSRLKPMQCQSNLFHPHQYQ